MTLGVPLVCGGCETEGSLVRGQDHPVNCRECGNELVWSDFDPDPGERIYFNDDDVLCVETVECDCGSEVEDDMGRTVHYMECRLILWDLGLL